MAKLISLPIKALRALVQRFSWWCCRLINASLHRLETRAGTIVDEPAPIFIVGPPRSGTTLLYQIIAEAYDFGYISNRHARFFGGISCYESWLKPLANRPPMDFSSNHGLTTGSCAPNECGAYWYQFFPKSPVYTTTKQFSDSQTLQLKRSVSRISKAFGRPVVFKNVMNSARIDILKRVFPQALFLRMERDEIDNGHSILKAKQKALGRMDQWWSLPPKGYEAFGSAPPAEQVIGQIRLTHRMIEDDLKDVEAGRQLRICYEDLCDAPHETLVQLDRFFESSLKDVKRRPQANIPDKFSRRIRSSHDDGLYRDLIEAAQAVSLDVVQ